MILLAMTILKHRCDVFVEIRARRPIRVERYFWGSLRVRPPKRRKSATKSRPVQLLDVDSEDDESAFFRRF